MEKYKAIVFDMDGTVLDTLDELTKSLNYVFARHGLPALTQPWSPGVSATGTSWNPSSRHTSSTRGKNWENSSECDLSFKFAVCSF